MDKPNVIRLATSQRDPQKRACVACRHVVRHKYVGPDCGATGRDIMFERADHFGVCGTEGKLWERTPPRIGLIGWVKRLLWGDSHA
jgi:hypothetical protein